VYSECVHRNTEKSFKSLNSLFFTFMACADISVSHLEREQEKARARELVFKPLEVFDHENLNIVARKDAQFQLR